jgi:hypothetical protein
LFDCTPGTDESAGGVVVLDEVVVSFVIVVLSAGAPGAGAVDEVVELVVVELLLMVELSLLAPVFGSVMPELTGGLFAPAAAAGPP